MQPKFLTLNCIIRKNQIEIARGKTAGQDETKLHTVEKVGQLEKILRKGFPEIKLTWGLSWDALMDSSDQYSAIRQQLREYHQSYGDEITFHPWGYFANRYNSIPQINLDISEAFRRIEDVFGYTPKSLIAGFLSAKNIQYAREHEGVIGIQGNIWSQYAVDNMDGDGSIAYPYYPSTEHFCKPAQESKDQIDCLNFDGWTVDFHNARLVGCKSRKKNSRMGVGPIETLGNLGPIKGLQEIQATTAAHFEFSAPYNPFTWVTNIIEVALVSQIPALPKLTQWIEWIYAHWPDVRCPTLAEFAQILRSQYQNNERLVYELHQPGNGIGASHPKTEIIWYMNSTFRCGIERNRWGQQKIFDYTRYKIPYQEPSGIGQRNWSIMDQINQKRSRPQDKPISFQKFPQWTDLLHYHRSLQSKSGNSVSILK
jgi:hypothetical protein